MFDMFDVMDSVFPILFGLVFCLVMGMFIYAIVHNVKEKRADDVAPVLTVEALVKTKRPQDQLRQLSHQLLRHL